MSFAEIKKDNVDQNGGLPQLYIDGKKTVPLWYALSDIPAAATWNDCSQRGIKNFANCGIDVVCIDSNLHEGWQENGEYNPEGLYSDICAVLMANPNAKIITRMHLNPPYWWLRKYPEEQIKFYGKRDVNGEQKYVELQNTFQGGYGDCTIHRKLPVEARASFASEQWLHDCGDILEQLCKKVKAHPLGKYLIGIQVAYGTCGEWHYWSSYDGNYAMADFSLPMQRLFRKIVKERYKSEEELKKYYGKDATFENVERASAEECKLYFSDPPFFLEPEKHMRVIDTMRLYSVSSANAICYFAKRIKEAWGEGMLVGSFYGYKFWGTSASGAHVQVQTVLQDKNVDFLGAPCGYSLNKHCGNMNLLRYVAESCRLHGKLMLCEMDQGYESCCNSAIYSCESEEEYATILKRNIMENILLGHGAWYYDHTISTVDCYQKQEYWNTPERLATIAQIQRACEKLQDKPYKKTTDVLIVVDSETRYYIKHDDCPRPLIDAIGKCGVGFDRLFLSDLERCDISRYKCVLFVNCRIMEQKTYDYIKNSVMADQRTIVFVNDFAKVVGKDSFEKGLEKIIGVPYVEDRAEYELSDCHVYRILEEKEYIDANFLEIDKTAYRKIFEKSGAHIYTDNGEVVVADNEMVMVHCKDVPKTTLHLHCGDVVIENGKYNTVVYNTFTGERIV